MNPDDSMIAATVKQYDELLEGPLIEAPVTKKYNKQIYSNSRMSGSAIEQHYEEMPDALFADTKPNLVVEHEQPLHRAMVFLKAQGLSNKEIAKRTGKTEPWISQILRQPFARIQLVKELTLAGRDSVNELIKASAEDSVYKLIEVRDNPKAKDSDKISAAKELLDRAFGKPTQHVETQITSRTLSDVTELDTKIAELEAEATRLKGN